MPEARNPLAVASELELVDTILATARDRLDAAACSAALLSGDVLIFCAADGAGADQIVGTQLPIGRGIAGWVVASGQAIAVADVHRDHRFDAETAAGTGYIPSTILAVPIEDEDGPIGVLEVLDRTPGARDLEIAGVAARQIALARQLSQLAAGVDSVLADPDLGELVAMVRRLGHAGPQQRTLAVRLLSAVLIDDS